jgi:hypothetical protein
MSAPFVQSSVERLIRAARKEGARIEIDLASGLATIIPDIHRPERVDGQRSPRRQSPKGNDAQDGEENW